MSDELSVCSALLGVVEVSVLIIGAGVVGNCEDSVTSGNGPGDSAAVVGDEEKGGDDIVSVEVNVGNRRCLHVLHIFGGEVVVDEGAFEAGDTGAGGITGTCEPSGGGRVRGDEDWGLALSPALS